MDKKTIGNWIMYPEIQLLKRERLSFAAIGKALVMDQRTVKRYLRMSKADYASFMEGKEVVINYGHPMSLLSWVNLSPTRALVLLKCMTG